jgi:hypothetical protein
MQISSLLQKFGRDLIYLLVIGGMTGWIWMERAREDVWNNVLSSDFKNLGLVSTRQTEFLEQGVYMLTDAYKTNRNEQDKKQMERVKLQIESFKQNVRNLHNPIIASTSFYEQALSAADLKNLEHSTQKLRDSLAQFIENEPLTRNKINFDLGLDSSSHFWKTGQIRSRQQAITFLTDLETKTDIAYATFLNYCSKHLDNYCGRISNFIPIMLPKKPVFQVNEPITAEIFLAPKCTDSNNLTIKINGKSLPVFGGFGSFSQRYPDPGEQKFQVLIERRNPLTGMVESFSKDYSLMIVDSRH